MASAGGDVRLTVQETVLDGEDLNLLGSGGQSLTGEVVSSALITAPGTVTLRAGDDITVPEDAISISISFDGRVSVLQAGSTEPTELGQLELARFINPAGLSAMGHNLFQETPASGTPIVAPPSEEGLGQIQQGYLEMSNVDVVTEMVNMIVAQRAYEINSKVIQTADDMSSLVNNLKR